MIDDLNDPLEADFAVEEAETPPEPTVVVVYRSRGVPWLLIPPLLLVAAVASIIAYRKSAPPVIRVVRTPAPTAVALAPNPVPPVVAPAPSTPPPVAQTLPPPAEKTPEPTPGAVEPATVVAQPPLPETHPEPIAPKLETPVAVATVPPPGPVVAPEPVPAVAVREERQEAVGFDPEATRVEAGAVAPAKPEKAKVPAFLARPGPIDSTPPLGEAPDRQPPDEAEGDRLQREAEDRLAARANLDLVKPDLLNADPTAIRKWRHAQIIEAQRLAAQDRLPFHSELREAIAERGIRAGSLIKQICNKYGRDTLPEIHGAMNKDLLGISTRMSTAGRIDRMRKWGVPETIILDDLAIRELEDFTTKGKFAVQRGGIRSEGEAWVRAARILIANPPSKPAASTARAAAESAPGR